MRRVELITHCRALKELELGNLHRTIVGEARIHQIRRLCVDYLVVDRRSCRICKQAREPLVHLGERMAQDRAGISEKTRRPRRDTIFDEHHLVVEVAIRPH